MTAPKLTADETHEMMMALDPTYRAQYWAGELSAPVGPYVEPPSINGLKPNINTSEISNPLSTTDIYKAMSAMGAPSYVVNVQSKLVMDDETLAEANEKVETKRAATTNGR